MLNKLQVEKRENDNLLVQFLARFPGVTKQHLHDVFREFHEKTLQEIDKSYDAVFQDMTMQAGTGSQPLVVNYNNRRHVFLWPISNLTAQVGDLGTYTFSAGNWYNISFREGLRIVNTGAGAVNVQIKCTNEVIP